MLHFGAREQCALLALPPQRSPTEDLRCYTCRTRPLADFATDMQDRTGSIEEGGVDDSARLGQLGEREVRRTSYRPDSVGCKTTVAEQSNKRAD